MAEPKWDLAACLGEDPDVFFPERGQPGDEAKAICARCPIRDACLEHALVNVERHGIWGGTSEKQRKLIRSERLHDGTLKRQCRYCNVLVTADRVVCDQCAEHRKVEHRMIQMADKPECRCGTPLRNGVCPSWECARIDRKGRAS